jgi:hypothetical protein
VRSRSLAVLAVLSLALSAVAQADPVVPCPRVVVEFERCRPGDPCHTIYQHPFASPDFKIEAVSGIPYVFIRESGGAGSEWETIGFYRDFDQRWESLFGFDLYDRVTAKADPTCGASLKARRTRLSVASER